MQDFKLKIEDGHLRVFAGRTPNSCGNKQVNLKDDLFIYVFTNRKLTNNLQSGLEVEVFKWVEN
jgi:hypothetical protein